MDKENKKRVAKAIVVQTKSGGVIQKSSQQLKAEHKWFKEAGIIEPPYNLDKFLEYYESNATFLAIVNQIATDVVGLGWSYVLKEGQKEDKNELKKIKEFITNISPDAPFRTLLKELLIDLGTCGYFCIEVVRNLRGEPSELYRVPAATVRVHKDEKSFVQLRENRKIWFSKFGSEEPVSAKDGKPVVEGGEAASEMIFFKNIYQQSDYYGVPNIIAALRNLTGLIEAGDYNISFFVNHGVPNSIITLEGEWEDDTPKIIEKFMKTEMQGSANAHKTLILPCPENCKLDYKPLGNEIKEGSFKDYQKDNRECILIAYSMPPARIGIHTAGALGGDTSKEANQIYKNGVVEPLQCDVEEIITSLFMEIGVTKYKFHLTDLDLVDHEKEAERVNKLVSGSVMTPNEGRKILGLPDAGPAGDVLLIPSSVVPEDVDIEKK